MTAAPTASSTMSDPSGSDGPVELHVHAYGDEPPGSGRQRGARRLDCRRHLSERGCSFAQSRTVRSSGQKRSLDLTAAFGTHRLAINAQLAVKIIQPNWIAKYYNFVVRSGRVPRVQISCFAPGETKPRLGCQA